MTRRTLILLACLLSPIIGLAVWWVMPGRSQAVPAAVQPPVVAATEAPAHWVAVPVVPAPISIVPVPVADGSCDNRHDAPEDDDYADLDLPPVPPDGVGEPDDGRVGMIHAYPDELSQQYAGANGAHRMKEALAVCKVQVNPIELWQLEDKQYTIRVAGKESAGNQPPAGEDVWMDIVLPHLSDADAKAKVKSWTLNWTGMEPHCFYLKQGTGVFEKQGNQGQIAVDDGKARFLGGKAVPDESQLQYSNDGLYTYAITGDGLSDLGYADGVFGQVIVKQRKIEQTLSEDNDFVKAPYGGTSLFGNKATIAITDDGPKPTLKPTSGLTGANTKFSVKYDAALIATGQDPAATGDGANQAAPILSWSDGSSFVVGGDRIGDTIIQVFPVFGGSADTADPLMEIPVQVDFPILSEPGVYQIEVARRNLELRKNYSGDGDLTQEPTPIPPAGGGTDSNWRLPTSYTMQWGTQHATRTKNTDDLDTVFEFCMHMMAQIAPAFSNGEGAWHLPVSGTDSVFQLKEEQQDQQVSAYELTLPQYRRMWNSGADCSDDNVAQRLQKSGPPLQQWLRFFKHFKANDGRDKRVDSVIVQARRLLEVKLKSYMDQAAIARLKRYFSLLRDYRANIMDGATSAQLDSNGDWTFGPVPFQGADVHFEIEIGFWRNLWDGIWKTGPMIRLFDTQITPNWHVGHPYTEEVINHMITERASWVAKLLKNIEDSGVQNGADNYPITIQVINEPTLGDGDFLWKMSRLPLECRFDSDKRIRFVVPDRFQTGPAEGYQDPRFKINGVIYPSISFADGVGGSADPGAGSIGRDSKNGFRLRVYHTLTRYTDLEVRGATIQAAMVVRLMKEIHALEFMLDSRASLAFWTDAQAHMGKFGFLLFSAGDFFAATTDIYRVIWGRDVVTNQQLTVEERIMSGMMVGVTVITGGVPGSAAVGKGVKFLKQGIAQDLAKTARANMTGVAEDITKSVDDMAKGGQDVGEAVVDGVRRPSGFKQMVRTTIEAGLQNVDSVLKLPVHDFVKIHCGLGRLGDSVVVRSGSQAPHLNPLCKLEKSAKRPVPSPSSVRAAPTAKKADEMIGQFENTPTTTKDIAVLKGAGKQESEICGFVAGEPQCFPAGTPVLMANGAWISIEQIKAGDLVASRSQRAPDSVRTERHVRSVIVSDATTMVEMRLIGASGSVSALRSTFSHPYWVHGMGWMQAGEIPVGAELDGGDQLLRVSSVHLEIRSETVYNLEVEVDRTYFVGINTGQDQMESVWVHNGCAMREIFENMIRNVAADLGQLPTDLEMLTGVKNYSYLVSLAGGRVVDLGKTFPHGFQSLAEFKAFSKELRDGLAKAGYQNAEPVFQGGAVLGFSVSRTIESGIFTLFDAASDFDIAIVAPDLFAQARKLGQPLHRGKVFKLAPLELARDGKMLEKLGLKQVISDLTELAGREVNIMIYSDGKKAVTTAPSILCPR